MYKTMQQIEEKKKKKFLSYFLESKTKESDQMEGERERKGWDKTTSQVALSQVLHMSVLSYSPNGIVHGSGGAMPVC